MTKPIDLATFTHNAAARKLVVVLHAYMLNPDSLRHIQALIFDCHDKDSVDIWVPALPLAATSCANPVAICNDLLNQIDVLWNARITQHAEAYDSIILVGHSFGALLARKVYVYACGENAKAPFESGIEQKSPRIWASKVERIVLLAGMNRGWSISHHMAPRNALFFSAGLAWGKLWRLASRKTPAIFHIRRGAPFLTNLRIQWLVMRQEAANGKDIGRAMTVQLLGSVDDMVSPEDNVDLVSGRDFIYLDVAKTGHSNIIAMNDSTEAADRKEKFRDALLLSQAALQEKCVIPSDWRELPNIDNDVTDLLFVMHGIRDLGYWTHKIARRVLARVNQNKAHGLLNERGVLTKYQTETSSYGYFPMLSFLFPWRRRAKVEWLMEQYAEGMAQYPNARFSYVGHSHGTYLLTKALNEYPCCQFKHVVLAGSVVRTDYAWSQFLQQGRVEKVLNYIASADWVVAWFPNAMQMLGLQDLGGAGHRGFDSGQIDQIQYVKGTHSAALHEDNWDAIADFVIHGSKVEPPQPIKESQQSYWVNKISKVAPLVWLGILTLLIGIGRWILPDLSGDEWRSVAFSGLYASGVILVLTKM